MDIIRRVFEQHGAAEMDTPVFEQRHVLVSKYGEEGARLMYDLADQGGGEQLSLRYDLTVPFARYLATHGIAAMKRCQVGRVYRRDSPAMNRGRFREFYQADFDIAGEQDQGPMIADAETLKVVSEVLRALDVGPFVVKLSHRGILDAILRTCGVDRAMISTVCSSIDKLDKCAWADVALELAAKGLDAATVDNVARFVTIRGPPSEVLDSLAAMADLDAGPALRDMRLLIQYADALGCMDDLVFDLSLARGLDYYTGLIFEAVLVSTDAEGCGSVAAGGRYDNLVESLAPSTHIPCVGASIGVDRLCALMKSGDGEGVRKPPVQVLVASVGEDMIVPRLRLLKELWAAGVSAQMEFHATPKPRRQLEAALRAGIPFMATIGHREVASDTVNLKDIRKSCETAVPRAELVARVLTLLGSSSS